MWDINQAEFSALIRRAEELRFLRQVRTPHATRPGRMLALIFEKASTRTRVSFEVAIEELGGHAVVLGRNDSQLGRGEPIKDTARVMSRYCHGIMVRTFGHDRVTELAQYSSVPVINGLSDLLHPCQVMADLQTVYAHFAEQQGQKSGVPDVLQTLRSVRYAWVGDGNNMANTWIEAAGLLGLDLMLACPEAYQPNAEVLETAKRKGQGKIQVVRDPREAVAGRHMVTTDVFTSMGKEEESETRKRAFVGYCVDSALMAKADPKAVFLHCLPAHRGEEVSEEVFESPASLVWQEAENRLHVQKALLEWVMT
jgi:ornithine carbamoyltransferase